MKRLVPFLVLLALKGVALAAPDPHGIQDWTLGRAVQDTPAPREPATLELAQGDFYPLERILNAIERRYPGHQLSVSGPTRSGDRYVYRIKWLTERGAVLYIVADAQSGTIVSVDGG